MASTLVLAFLAQGCGSGLSGEVRDAISERPVANARVEVTTVGWGRREGDLVWDKSFTHAASTDARGRFKLDISAGGNLRVSASGYRMVESPVCSRSPMTVRVGGPFDGADLGRQLRTGIGPDGAQVGWRFGGPGQSVRLAEADLAAERMPTAAIGTARLRAPLGMVFVPGTGNPPAPPANGYVQTLDVDLLDCGWLFVRAPSSGLAAVRIGSFVLDEPLEGGRFLMLSFGTLPAAGRPN